MNRTEASALLTFIARTDNRNIDREVVEVWADLLDDVALADALPAAREHLRTDDRWLTPALLRGRIRSGKPLHRPVADVLRQAEGDPDQVRRAADVDFEALMRRPT